MSSALSTYIVINPFFIAITVSCIASPMYIVCTYVSPLRLHMSDTATPRFKLRITTTRSNLTGSFHYHCEGSLRPVLSRSSRKGARSVGKTSSVGGIPKCAAIHSASGLGRLSTNHVAERAPRRTSAEFSSSHPSPRHSLHCLNGFRNFESKTSHLARVPNRG